MPLPKRLNVVPSATQQSNPASNVPVQHTDKRSIWSLLQTPPSYSLFDTGLVVRFFPRGRTLVPSFDVGASSRHSARASGSPLGLG
ncbi:hypothetical protein H0G86_005233 [Trichoderma simmonsii]|uniref:Uncharacterized protein n=1 Tax=Trichoderma simmonsii TaxID=1491479 RepID=A0A8G0LC31_9HYPO|nr:hypothetical protein H0G86_005233 [Trichoderma simmonsii]